MTKEEHIAYWISLAEKDWKVVKKLYQTKEYVYCLFFTHLTIEKFSKALWVKNNEDNYPPKKYNIVYLLEKSNIQLSDEQKDFLLILNDFQLEGRYPDYKQKIYKICTKHYTDDILVKVKKIKIWLRKML
ncbi:MAG: HEPN domain-containing protein [Bacteroidia bacterium]|nr:HEPN domain-containing protein [Bacteroidia bacterium]